MLKGAYLDIAPGSSRLTRYAIDIGAADTWRLLRRSPTRRGGFENGLGDIQL